MRFSIDRSLAGEDFEAIVARTRAALAAEGFGVVAEIDVRSVLRSRLGKDVNEYLILGACHPQLAHEAMQIEPRVGVMLPCNVIRRRTGPRKFEVSAVNPVAAMADVGEKLDAVAGKVRGMLERAVAHI